MARNIGIAPFVDKFVLDITSNIDDDGRVEMFIDFGMPASLLECFENT
jgi:hypothetical protein